LWTGDSALLQLEPERVGQGLDGPAATDGEAIQDQENVQVAQGELPVELQQREGHPSQPDAGQYARVGGDRGQRCLIRPRRPTSPSGRDGRPEPLVDGESLLVRLALASHPLDRLLIECVELVDGPLAASFQHVPVDPRHTDRQAGASVRILVQPARSRGKGAVRPSRRRTCEH
jgi:hypothetical protein